MKATFYGHSCVLVETEKVNILFDPFISGNESNDLSPDDLPKIDCIILTHGHNDHVGDTMDIADKHGSKIIAVFELAGFLEGKGYDTHGLSIGGGYNFDFGRVKLTQAFHGSSYETEEGIVYTGMPAGVILEADGKTVYHAGDTGLFSDMKMIGDRNDIDLAFIPIGDNFTMGPEDALQAAEWIQAKTVVPVHYNTFPPIKQDPHQFVDQLKGMEGKVLEAGETLEF